MIPPLVEAYEHAPVDLERSSGSWIPTEFFPTYVQLLLICAVLLFGVLLHVLRCLRHSRAGTSSSCRLAVGDKELCEPQKEYQLSEKSAPQSSSASAPGRGWWWVDALLGRDAEEEAVVNAACSMVIQTHRQLACPEQNDLELQGYKDSITYYRPQEPRRPISMAKLIMSRHAQPPRRPRSPPKPATTTTTTTTTTTAATTQPHSRPPSRLASSCAQVV